jgi:hypothetical protein
VKASAAIAQIARRERESFVFIGLSKSKGAERRYRGSAPAVKAHGR